MRKIESMIFEDFRAFYDEVKFDFKNNNGEAADFVCIYGQNGVGKSSFFDGIEWLYTGKIDRFEDDVKSRIKGYKGCILRNSYSEKKEIAVSAIYDKEGGQAKRTFKQGAKHNDYHPDKAKPLETEDIIHSTQIMPHNKIDSFVYAKSPQQKFQEWSKFWDPNGEAVEYLKKIIAIKKQIEKGVKDLEGDLKEKNSQLKEIGLDSNVISRLNGVIERYNDKHIGKCSKITPIFLENDVWRFPNINILAEQKEYLENYREKNEQMIKIAQYLISNYFVVEEIRNKVKVLEALISRWERIESGCQEKISYIKHRDEKKNELKEIDKEVEKLELVCSVTEEWFDNYNNISKNKKLIPTLKKELVEMKELHIKLIELKDSVMKKAEEEKKKLSNMANKREEILNDVKVFVELIEKLVCIEKDKDQLKVNYSTQDEKLRKYKDVLRTIEYIDTSTSELELINQIQNFSPIDEKDKLVRDKYILELNNKFEEIKFQKNIIDELEKRYKEMKNDYTQLENNIIEVRDYVIKEKLDQCPICQAKYKSLNELLQKISSVQEFTFLKELNEKISKEHKRLQEFKFNKQSIIKKWNDYLYGVNSTVKTKINLKNEQIYRISLNLHNIDLLIEDKKKNILSLQEKFVKQGYSENEINLTRIEDWLEAEMQHIQEKIKTFVLDLKEVENNIEEESQEVKRKNELIELVEEKEKEFLQDINNRKIVSIIEELGLSLTWKEIQERRTYLVKKQKELQKSYKELEYNIAKLSYIDENSLTKYTYKLNEKKKQLIKAQDNKILTTYLEYTQELYKGQRIKIKSLNLRLCRLTIKNEVVTEKINYIKSIYYNEGIERYKEKYERIKIDFNKIEKKKEEFIVANTNIEKLYEKVKDNIQKNLMSLSNNQIVRQIYKKIEPHKEFEDLVYEVSFSNDGKPELYIKGVNPKNKNEILPELFYSSAQLNTMALSMFLGEVLSIKELKVNTIFIDDPIAHFDDINVLAFVDLLRTIISTRKWQVIMSTHDESLYNLLSNKLSSQYYNSKFLKFASVGVLEK